MATVRVQKTKNYTVMSNNHLKNKELSLKAKGLLSFMLSLPDDWDYTIEGLAACCADGKDSVMTALRELKKFGYLTVERKGTGKYEYEYTVAEIPMRDFQCGKPESENPNRINNNTNNKRTNISSPDGEDMSSSNETQTDAVASCTPVRKSKHPTLEEVKAYVAEKKNGVDPEIFYEYYSEGDWKDSQGNPVKNWKQKMIAVWVGKDWWKKNKKNTTPVSKYEDLPKSFRTAYENLGLNHNKTWMSNINSCVEDIKQLKVWFKEKQDDDKFYWANVNSEWPNIKCSISNFWESYLTYIMEFVELPAPAHFRLEFNTFNRWCKEMGIKV